MAKSLDRYNEKPFFTGLSARMDYFEDILSDHGAIQWLEILIDNFLGRFNFNPSPLDAFAEKYPLAFHGTELSLGGLDPINQDHLLAIKTVCDRYNPFIVSEHLCWTTHRGRSYHDLLPIPFLKNMISHVAERIDQVQQVLGRQLCIENISYYVRKKQPEMPEWDFLNAVSDSANCGILFDVSNLYLNSKNWGYDPMKYISNLNWERVQQMHLGGFRLFNKILVDSHSAPIDSEVWKLLQKIVRAKGLIPTCVEWDNDLPEYSVLRAQLEKLKSFEREGPHPCQTSRSKGGTQHLPTPS